METTTSTPKSSSNTKLILGCVIGLVIAIICICCSVCTFAYVAPVAFTNAFFSDESANITVEKWSESEINKLESRLDNELKSEGETKISGDELTQLFLSDDENKDTKFRITINDKDQAEIDLSVKSGEEKYLNISLTVDFEIQNGEFTRFIIEELKIGSFNLSSLFRNQDIADSLNRNLNESEREELKTFIENFETLKIKDGNFVIDLTEEGRENLLNQSENEN